MTSFYTEAQRAVQAQMHTAPLADLLEQAIIHDEVQPDERAFIESRDMFFLATTDASGQPTCSYKGGDPGFVRVLGPRTLAFPIYDGNGMFLSVGNMQETAKVGLLFIDFQTPHRLRVQGSASLASDAALRQSFPGADRVVRVAIDKLFVNCARYVHRYQRDQPSPYVPREGSEPPYPAWKRIDAVQGVLAPRDAGKTEAAGGTITMDEYVARVAAGQS